MFYCFYRNFIIPATVSNRAYLEMIKMNKQKEKPKKMKWNTNQNY